MNEDDIFAALRQTPISEMVEIINIAYRQQSFRFATRGEWEYYRDNLLKAHGWLHRDYSIRVIKGGFI